MPAARIFARMASAGRPVRTPGAPMKVGVALADVLAGKDAAIQILAALAGGRLRLDAKQALDGCMTMNAYLRINAKGASSGLLNAFFSRSWA